MKVSISDEVFEVTNEQLGKIKAIVKVEKKFEKVKLCHLRISVSDDGKSIWLGWFGSGSDCFQTPKDIRETIEKLQSVLAFVENN